MTTQALYNTTCTICEKIAHLTLVVLKEIWSFCEAVGKAQAANRLSAMGYYEEAKKVMLND